MKRTHRRPRPPRLPAAISEELITMLCRDIPGARRWVQQRTLPGEMTPRAVLDGDGLQAFVPWLVMHSPLTFEEQKALAWALHDLSLEAGMPGVIP